MPRTDALIRHGSSVEQITDMSAFEEAVRERLCHIYPHDTRYRLSGAEKPNIGDIAYCGHVKDIPYTNGASKHWPKCQSCTRLEHIIGWI